MGGGVMGGGGPRVGGLGGPVPLPHLNTLHRPLVLSREKAEEILRKTEERQQRVNALIDKIASGKSQLSIDTSPIAQGSPQGGVVGAIDRAEGERFKKQQLEYLKELARTEVGLKLLTDLDASPLKTTIQPGSAGANETSYADRDAASYQDAANTVKGPGSAVTIGMNPHLTSYQDPGEAEQPWMTERQKYGLYHELVHAWHAVNGTRAQGEHDGTDVRDGSTRSLRNAEFQAMGMGPWHDQPVSEVTIRQQMGKPARPHYDHLTY
jgi:hypothetical protein